MKILKTVNNQVIVKCVITDVNKKGLPICMSPSEVNV